MSLVIYPKENFCDETMHNYSGCIVIMYTSLLCEILPRKEGVTSNVSMINNAALLSGSVIFYNDMKNFAPSQRSANISDPSSLFNIPDNFNILPNASESLVLSTQPYQFKLLDPAVCNNVYTHCNISRIALGEEIKIPIIALGYNNKAVEATRFLIECFENYNFFRIGDSIVLINDMFSGKRITGAEIRHNTSVTLRLYIGMINLKLKVELVPCQLGYTYSRLTEQCQCYSVDNIVSCGSDTTIKNDYWFGTVGDQVTVSLCSNKYCNFSLTEVNSGNFRLSSTCNDQCAQYRTGQACGRCDSEYTLSFDFDDCVYDDDCSPGITILIIICVILYWIIIMAIILLIMYFKINIGYLYGIIYYYSAVDILLRQVINYSNGLDVLDKIITSIVRLSPGFVGFLCLLRG